MTTTQQPMKKYKLLVNLPDGAMVNDIYSDNGYGSYVNERMAAFKSPVIEHNSYFSWQVENKAFFELVTGFEVQEIRYHANNNLHGIIAFFNSNYDLKKIPAIKQAIESVLNDTVEDKADITNEGLGKLMMSFDNHYKKMYIPKSEVDAMMEDTWKAARSLSEPDFHHTPYFYRTMTDYKATLPLQQVPIMSKEMEGMADVLLVGNPNQEAKDKPFVWTDELVLLLCDLCHHNGWHKFGKKVVEEFDEFKTVATKKWIFPSWIKEHLQSKQSPTNLQESKPIMKYFLLKLNTHHTKYLLKKNVDCLEMLEMAF